MASPRMLTFGALLKRYRVVAGLTQEELADKAGLSARAISALERGVSHLPRRDTVALLADALSLAPAERAFFQAAARERVSAPAVHESEGGVIGNPPPIPLAGRMAELAVIERHLAGEGPPCWLLVGEPGIGKTRLLEEAARRGVRLGWEVVMGGCQRQSGQRPYDPFPQALLRVLSARPRARQRLDVQGCGWLVRLLPELAEDGILPAPTWTLPPEQERRLMIAAVRRLLANIARPAGTLLLLDDLQWAGADALDLLDELLRGAHADRLRVVVAYRETEVGPESPLARLMSDVAREGLIGRLRLGPLVEAEATQLLDALLAEAPAVLDGARRETLRRAGGVPFFLVSWARQAREGMSADPAGGVPGSAIPWTVTASVRQRVAVLPDTAQDVIAVVALAGSQADRRLLIRVAAALGQTELEAVSALEAACRAGLLIEAGDDGYACSHDLIRDVVVGDLLTARRRLLHRLIGEALEGNASSAAALAWHFDEAGEATRALPCYLQAGDDAEAVYAHGEAERLYQRALDLAQAAGNGMREAEAQEKRGFALIWQTRDDEALELLEQALASARRRGDGRSTARIVLRMSRPYVDRGTPQMGIAQLEDVRRMLAEGEPTRELALLSITLTHLYYGTGQYPEELAAAERALVAAQAIGDVGLTAHAQSRRGAALALLGRLAEALPALMESAPAAEDAGDWPAAMWALHNAASVRAHLGFLDEAEGDISRALELAERLAAPDWIAAQLCVRSMVAFVHGDWPAARADVARAKATLAADGAPWVAAMVHEASGRLALVAGDHGEAARLLEDALTQAEHSGDLQRVRAVQLAQAECELLSGEAAAARDRLLPLLDRPGMEETDVNALLPTLAEAYLLLGAAEEADALAERTCKRLRAQGDRLILMAGLHVRARAAMRRQRWELAQAAAEETLSLSRAIASPYAEARALAACGELWAARGDEPRARDIWKAALAICTRLGERPLTEQMRRALAQLSQPKAPPA
jgi:transcriptional regulator with XRE-family HTH domain/tetratricopeptide (TPR) repeat protein